MAPSASSPSSSSSAATTSVQVALRIRPATSHDASSIPPRFQRTVIHSSSATTVSVDPVSSLSLGSSSAGAAALTSSSSPSGKKQNFTFDQVHGPSTTQHAIFTSTAYPLISRFVEGFNCTILAYGQTSSGKTFTMTGIDLDADPADPHNGMGIIPRAVSTIFSRAREIKEERGAAWTYTLKGSFIEIYNEDLIDLLTVDESGSGGRRDVQIREDKHGHIIWDGLREVNVKNATEVMSLIRKGSSIRRTNETEMNAQSSRSHAIFSLTLTQKKYTGSGRPVRSSSPLPPTGRSPSRLARPGSMYAGPAGVSRTSSPTFGRPPTPSFAVAMNRGGGASGLRPPSSLGHRLNDGKGDDEGSEGEWVTVVSKFHFVDLAGSERLKRTAAQGERIKEGISINSGLLALGNVISALGDPSRVKSHTASYIPYRDSKLTRLLQDSLGGNAHTLMIACASPAEWNLGETVNTLKYANRARNIKNRAVVNEKEEGWEDVEWLQGMVTRLRRELKGIKDTGGSTGSLGSGTVQSTASSEISAASAKVVAQMVELQNNYEELREQFTQRTEELTRLRRELAEKHRSSSSSTGGMSKYEEIVGPVIEEYEKTISAMEAELSLNRAALRHTNELIEEKEEELTALSERHAATDLYLEELRSRVTRLSEREASTEAYIRDLEEKVKQYDESTTSSSESMSDLKREITRYKDTESHSSRYIADLEARLARSDESIIGLQQTVEALEKESERRRDEAESLKSRLESLTKDGQSWRDDLLDREQKVKELERKMEEWESKRKETNEERLRLGNIVNEVSKARQSLQLNVPFNGAGSSDSSRPDSPVSSPGPVTPAESAIENQLVSLQQTHTATLADLSSVTSKYRDALREIHELSSQLQETKLASSSGLPDASERISTTETPIFTRRRITRNGSEPGKRLFFRQAASAESLHSRSLSQSQSLSQELSSARLRKASFSSHGSNSPVSHSRSSSASRPNLSISTLGGISSPEKSMSSLEREIMRLQEVLKDRESEIAILEESLKEDKIQSLSEQKLGVMASDSFRSAKEDMTEDAVSSEQAAPVEGVSDPSVSLSPKTIGQFHAIRQSMQTDNKNNNLVNGSEVPDSDGSLQRLNDLMRSMAQKESQHREIVDSLDEQLSQVRKQHEELTALSRDQIHNMSSEIEALHDRHAGSLSKLEEMQEKESRLLDMLKQAGADHSAAVDRMRAEHEDAKESEADALVTRLKEEHERTTNELRDQLAEASAALEQAHQNHAATFGKLETEHEEALNHRSEEVKVLLEQLEKEHQEVLAKAVSEHQAILTKKEEESTTAQRRIQEIEETLEQTRKEHEDAIARVTSEHADTLKRKDEDSLNSLHQTEEEYYNALTKLRNDHAEALERQSLEASISLDRLKEEHAGQLRVAEIAKEGSLSESQTATEAAMRDLKEAQSLAIIQKEMNFAQDLERLKADHLRTLTNAIEEHDTALEKARSDHAIALSKTREESQEEIMRLTSLLEDSKTSSLASMKKVQEETEAALQTTKEQHAVIIHEIEASQQAEVERLKVAHQDSLDGANSKASQLSASLHQSHADEVDKLKAQHEVTIAEIQSTLTTIHDQERKDVEAQSEQQRLSLINTHTDKISALKLEHQSIVLETAARFERDQTDFVTRHAQEVDRLKAEHESAIAGNEAQVDQLRSALLKSHAEETAKLKTDHRSAIAEVEATLIATREQHLQELDAARIQSEQLLFQERERLREAAADLEIQYSKERDTWRKDHELLLKELSTYGSTLEEVAVAREEASSQYQKAVMEKDSVLDSLQEELTNTHIEHDDLEAEVARLRGELDSTRNEQAKLLQEASQRQTLVEELEKHRSMLAETQVNLQRTQDEKEALQAEKTRQETLVRDLQAQRARSPSPTLTRTTSERPMIFARQSSLPPAKPPPPTPPPSVPPPPTPKESINGSSVVSIMTSIASTKESQLDSPATSFAPSLVLDPSISSVDVKVNQQQIEQQAKLIGEQEAMIKTLNKQLTHCESDLQTHMDLVSTLEASLGDSEKNLRKARMHATELARERDTLNSQITALRTELTEAKREVVTVRRSVVEEKQSLEHRLDEERKAKERARAQLDSRVEEIQKRKSKFVCL